MYTYLVCLTEVDSPNDEVTPECVSGVANDLAAFGVGQHPVGLVVGVQHLAAHGGVARLPVLHDVHQAIRWDQTFGRSAYNSHELQ